MGNMTTYEGVVAYAKQILISFAQNSKVAIFNDPTNQVLDIKGKETLIREVETTGAGDYTGVWGDGVGTAENNWVSYYAPYDRTYSAAIDTLKEVQSYMDGSKPTLPGVATEYIKKHLAPEIDSVILARYAVEAAIKKQVSELPVDKENILATLTNIEAEISNAGYDGDIVTYLSTDANAAFEQALLEKNILASDVVIKRQMTREEIADGFEPLEIEIRARKFNNLLIIPVPNDRMCGKYIMLNGTDPGQEDGGVIPAKNAASYTDNKVIAIPLEAAFANIRHIVSQLFVPSGIDVNDYNDNIALANEKLFGVMTLENSGINQLADGFKFNSRCVYGGDIFEKYRDTAVVVYAATGKVNGIEATRIATPLEDVTASATFTKTIVCAPLNMTTLPTAVSSVEGKATVSVAAGTNNGEAVLTVTKVAAGSSVITLYADAAKTKELGSFTVTFA